MGRGSAGGGSAPPAAARQLDARSLDSKGLGLLAAHQRYRRCVAACYSGSPALLKRFTGACASFSLAVYHGITKPPPASAFTGWGVRPCGVTLSEPSEDVGKAVGSTTSV